MSEPRATQNNWGKLLEAYRDAKPADKEAVRMEIETHLRETLGDSLTAKETEQLHQAKTAADIIFVAISATLRKIKEKLQEVDATLANTLKELSYEKGEKNKTE